jgi:hypothetical protein
MFWRNISPPSSGQKNPRARNQSRWLYMEAICQFTQELHGATSQKTTFFMVTAVKTSNLTQSSIVSLTLENVHSMNTELCYIL